MKIVLGIDTGGTFTDSVIVNTTTKEVLQKAKALTTKEDLAIGIKNSLDKLSFDEFDKLSFVSLSTTLATNAIVENRRCRTGIILVGKKTDKKLPTDLIFPIDGTINIKGHIQKELNYKQIENAVDFMTGKIDALAISGFASIRNPIHELQIKEYIKEKLGVPIVCAHELTGQLGFYERTVTCILNAGLIPIITELITATKSVLQQKNVNAPIMVVKGDGALMQESVATDKPVETILSGPAASIIGTEFLTNMGYTMILDMGGTTTDVANLVNGKVHIKEDGARIGGWPTRVRAADISTFGLGGDSHIYYDGNGKIHVGPKRVIPISVATSQYPKLIEELEKYKRPEGHELCIEKETDCFIFIKKNPHRQYSDFEEEMIEILNGQPHALFWLAQKFEMDADRLELTRLVDDGTLGRISFTPTDILHAEGHLHLYDDRGAKIALEILANRKGVTPLDFIITVKRLIYRELATLCIQSACDFDNAQFNIKNEDAAVYFLDRAFLDPQASHILQTKFMLTKPIVAIGAPVTAWMYKVGQLLNTTIIIPEHAEVANAIGAAVGSICEEIEVLIRYDSISEEYLIYTPKERLLCDNLIQAKAMARETASKLAREAANRAGGENSEIVVNEADEYTNIFTSGIQKYVGTKVKAIALGKPKWC